MKHLSSLHKYFWKYRVMVLSGVFFVILSNYFAVLAPEVTGYIIGKVQQTLPGAPVRVQSVPHDILVNYFVQWVNKMDIGKIVVISSITILVLAIIRGAFMFFMRQTLIVMSRHVEYDIKNEVYNHYQQLDSGFFKTHSTGDLMNRITEDVSRVRMYIGPAFMYLINLVALIGFCVVNMLRKNIPLTIMVLAPLPVLAIAIYAINTIIHKKSEKVQSLLSDLTTNAQESYSGIRVIKSFVQEKAMLQFFKNNSEEYRKNTVSLAKVEAIYFPSMTLMIGLSVIITIFFGTQQVLNGTLDVGIIVEFIIYINMLMFPVSAIGAVASMIQRAAASQKRINEFLHTESLIKTPPGVKPAIISGDIVFKNVSFTYPHTGIKALQNFSINVKEGEKFLILGRTGSGKSTLSQLLLRFYDPDIGDIFINNKNIKEYALKDIREQISYVPQDIFLFSDTIANNISFGLNQKATIDEVQHAAKLACIHNEITGIDKGYETLVGERGITLSGGQKQRVSIARALIKHPQVMVFDDCLSAVDSKTENDIIHNLYQILYNKTAIIITHRIFTGFKFDRIVILDDGKIIEQGTHNELLKANGYYAELYRLQITSGQNAA